jgi:Ser/Thr protein kinase RdoA (MazF antagonist)
MREVERALAAWDVSVRDISIDSVPEVHHVESKSGERYVLKDVGEPDVLVRTETQFRVTRYVHTAGLPIAYLLATREGSFCSRIDDSIFILMPHLPDDDPDFYGSTSGPLYRTLGQAYGRLHAILSEFDGPIETWEDNAYDPLFNDYVPEALPKLSGETKRRVEDLLSEVEPHLKAIAKDLPMEPVFQDVHRGNVRMVDGEFHGFIDCDHICIGQRIDDISGALTSMIKYRGRNGLPVDGDTTTQRGYWLEHFCGFLSAYHAVNPIRPLEVEHIPYAMLTCCLPEVEAIDGGSANLDLMDWYFANRSQIESRIQRVVAQ